jgi:hypothetical protein
MTVADRVVWIEIDGRRYLHWDDVCELRWWRSLTAAEQAELSQDTDDAELLGMVSRDAWARRRYGHLLDPGHHTNTDLHPAGERADAGGPLVGDTAREVCRAA